MESLKYYSVKPSAFPEVTDLFNPLIDHLQTRWDSLAKKKKINAKMNLLTETKIGLQALQSFIWVNNWMGAYGSLKAHPVSSTTESLRTCFRDDPEIQKSVLEHYKTVMVAVLEWMHIQYHKNNE